MKKASKIFAIVFAVMLVSLFSGCALLSELWNKVKGPVDEWTNFEVTMTYKGTQVNLDVYCMYVKDGFTNKNMKTDYTFNEEGLAIVVAPYIESGDSGSTSEDKTTKEEYAEILKEFFGDEFNTSYLYKFWKNGEAVIFNKDSEGNIKEDGKAIKMSQTAWNLIYAGSKYGAGLEIDDEAGLPFCLNQKNKSYKEYKLDKDDMWKKILAAILINKLL